MSLCPGLETTPGVGGWAEGETDRPDPDGRAEEDLRGVNTGVGMWEMGVREMSRT